MPRLLTEETGLLRIEGRPKYHLVNGGGQDLACSFRNSSNSDLMFDLELEHHARRILDDPSLLCSNCLRYWFDRNDSNDHFVARTLESKSGQVEYERDRMVAELVRLTG